MRKSILIQVVILLLIIFFPIKRVEAISGSKIIGGCEFRAYLTNTSGSRLKSIGPNTEYYFVVEWTPGDKGKTDCDNYNYGELGNFKAGFWDVPYSLTPQFCNQKSTLGKSIRSIRAKFNTGRDADIKKYFEPLIGTSVCDTSRAKSQSADSILLINQTVGTSTVVEKSQGVQSNNSQDPQAPQAPETPKVPAGKKASDIDTSVTIKGGLDFDQELSRLFNPLDFEDPKVAIVRILNILLTLAGILAVLFIIIGGFQMVTATGSESKMKAGKQTVIYAVAGLILTLLSFSIVALIQRIISG